MMRTRFEVKENNWAPRRWFVEGRENGKRCRKFFKTKAQAKTHAGSKNNELLNRRIEHAEFPTALRVMAQDRADTLRPFGKSIKDATDFFLAHLKASEKSCTAVQLVKELVAAKEKDGASARHVADLRSRLNIFAKQFDGKPLATITSTAIDDWLRSLNVSPVTRNHYRRVIVLAFNFAVRRGYAADNPAKQTDKAKEHAGDIGILTVDQAARLLENATPEVFPYIAIGMFAGLRREEIQRLAWSEIDFASSLIEVKAQKSKTAQRRHVTIQPNLRAWLWPVRKHKGPVIPGKWQFRLQFDQARAAAGITEWPDNALRHSFASYHLAHFKNAAATAMECGHHDSRITYRHYRELVRPKEAKKYWSIKPLPKDDRKTVAFTAK